MAKAVETMKITDLIIARAGAIGDGDGVDYRRRNGGEEVSSLRPTSPRRRAKKTVLVGEAI
jgi:hypothetical protein